MPLIDLSSLSIGWSLGLFAAGGLAIWLAGTRLSLYAEEIAERTGVGRAFIGALLLGGITSLPEVVTTVTASLGGHPEMAVNNVLGGVAMQVAVIALADAWVRVRSISSVPRQPVPLLQGNALVLVLALTATGVSVGEPAGLPVGLWTTVVLVVTVVAFAGMRRYEGHVAWEPLGREEEELERLVEGDGLEHEARDLSLRRLLLSAAAAILVAGVAVTRAGEALAEQTGLGTSFVGVALLALSTSLPEISTTVAAARLGRFDMAFSNVFGANLLDMALLFVTDAVAGGPPVLNGVGQFALVAALLATALTALFLGGIVWRHVRTLGRLGVDSLLVLVTYFGGLYLLFTLR